MQPTIVDSKAAHAARARLGAGLILLVTAGLIGGCGSSGSSSSSTATAVHLNTSHVARAIEGSILAERHIHATVKCPAVIVQHEGRDFVCIATTRDSNGVKHRTPFAVTQQNNSGYVTYRAQ